jgi:hypothetical protein
MIIEHLFYSAAIAIIVGMLYYKITGRDYSWIIIFCALVPDFDVIANKFLNKFGLLLVFEGQTSYHGTFHNVAMMVIFGIIVAFLLLPFGIKFFDSAFFLIIGFGAHLFEDALVYKSGYKFLWPLSSQAMGIGLLPDIMNEENYIRDFFGIANTEILLIGSMFLIIAVTVRTYFDGPTWIRWYMPNKLYLKYFCT